MGRKKGSSYKHRTHRSIFFRSRHRVHATALFNYLREVMFKASCEAFGLVVQTSAHPLARSRETVTRVVYLLQMTSCVLYQAVVACTWVLGHSFSTLDLAPLVYMFAVTGIIWPTLAWTPYRNPRASV
jgi:hypothetical protein